ncbi:MAG: hypothetical protein LBU27_09190 [Candidatus Peribacteria bacterium]|jgi:hypothetical protein|nr:hypothetical protein [Candidatus Peribacteria bacterium]
MMGDEVIDSDQVEHFGDKLKTKFQGVDNHGTPLYSNVIEDIKIIDNTKAIVSGLDGRLYNSNMVAMALGLDLRSLGYMRAGGSQAELKEVLKMANAKITRTAEELSAKLQEEFEALVQELPKGVYFKFIPTLFRDVQQVMDNYLKAHQQGAVSNEELLDLLHNQ